MKEKHFIKKINEGEDCRVAFIGYKKLWFSVSIGKLFVKFSRKKLFCRHTDIVWKKEFNMSELDYEIIVYCDSCRRSFIRVIAYELGI